MPSTPKKSGIQAYPVELSLQSLKNCLVNLPSQLTSVLVNSNTPAQDIIVELIPRQNPITSPSLKQDGRSTQNSIYVGWTGLESRKRLASVLGGDSIEARRNGTPRKEQDVAVVEIDITFAKSLGLSEGQKVGVLLHPNPTVAHTVNIEPLTPTDWEIIELHANFLEINLLAQIRALTNPLSKSGHPLTLHLSPTSTANIIVTALEPQIPASSPFAKLSPNGEIIVAPKSRMDASHRAAKETVSTHSVDGRSSTSTLKTKSRRSDTPNRHSIFLRGIHRNFAHPYFDNSEDVDHDTGIKIWVDWSVLSSDHLRSVSHVLISIVHPAGLRQQADAQKHVSGEADEAQEQIKPAMSIIARLCPWEDAPDRRHVAISSQLCAMLDLPHPVGETIKIEPAPSAIPKSALKAVRIYPFPIAGAQKAGFQFGGKSKATKEDAGRKILSLFGESKQKEALFQGPITDGMVLPALSDSKGGVWSGGILKFEPSPATYMDKSKSTKGWFSGSEKKIVVRSASDGQSQSSPFTVFLEFDQETGKPAPASSTWTIGESLPATIPALVGVDRLLDQLHSHIKYGSSVLLTGGHGSGKTSFCHVLANCLRGDLFHTTYFPCRSLVTDETRIATVKEDLNRAFSRATWNARNGGRSLVVLDDVDKLCPVETELEVGNDNGRSRHLSEVLVSVAKHYCARDSGVIILATAKGKEEVNNVIISGHIVREIVSIPSPDKEIRRIVLEALTTSNSALGEKEVAGAPNQDMEVNQVEAPINGHQPATLESQSIFEVDSTIDYLDIASRTDGYMPGDLKLLIARARSEALIRAVSESSLTTQFSATVQLKSVDFTSALKGFTPSSLLNVTLQHSSTTFASIGGLRETRKILLETLQYPTLYAPIFARCPLRLRSGLLLYGYPGCGKTLLASAVAGECGLNFISVKGPEILNKYIGASEKSVRDLFERAQAARPCVLFFDEFDSVAPKRGHDSTGVTDRVVNQLLTQMDGAEGLSGVYVLAATSRPDLIDPALLRPGRLDKSLLCDMPAYEDRLEILQALCQKLKVSPDLLADQNSNDVNGAYGVNGEYPPRNLQEVAHRTEGYSGADLQAVVYNAHLEAIHDVLGDRGKMGRSSETGAANGTKAIPNEDGVLNHDFKYFLLDPRTEASSAPLSAAAKATERAKIAAQLSLHRSTQRSRNSQAWDHDFDRGGRNGRTNSDGGNQEPVIEWQHIERSLHQTRASISAQERERLRRVYREFVVGRSGEMRDGQGGSEIGGRTSLM